MPLVRPSAFFKTAHHVLFAGLIAISLVFSTAAHAQEQEVAAAAFDDDVDEAPVLMNRWRPLKLNLEISVMFMPTLIEKYLNHLGGVAALSFHINDIFAVEVMGGYLFMRETSIIGGAEGVRFAINRAGEARDPNLPDLVGMSWLVQAGATIAPIYGKLNFFSEFDLNSQVYITGGLGVVGAVKRQYAGIDEVSTIIAPNPGGAVKFAGNFGLGFRLFFARWFAIRAEFRDILFADSFDFKGNGTPETDIIHNFMGLFGLSFIVY